MTAPTCSSRTWVAPDLLVTCDREHEHEGKHAGDVPCPPGWRTDWYEPACRFVLGRTEHVFSLEETRELVALLQRQLDAFPAEVLGPDAAIAEAERRMRDARLRVVDLVGITDAHGDDDTAEPEVDAARFELKARHGEWIALLRARAAKDGGT